MSVSCDFDCREYVSCSEQSYMVLSLSPVGAEQRLMFGQVDLCPHAGLVNTSV